MTGATTTSVAGAELTQLAALFASGQIAVVILALIAVEAAGLVAYYRATGRGVKPADLFPNLASGACLMTAVGLALAGAWWGWIGACLFGSLIAHAADLRARWRG